MKRKTIKNVLKLGLLIVVVFVVGYMVFTWANL